MIRTRHPHRRRGSPPKDWATGDSLRLVGSGIAFQVPAVLSALSSGPCTKLAVGAGLLLSALQAAHAFFGDTRR